MLQNVVFPSVMLQHRPLMVLLVVAVVALGTVAVTPAAAHDTKTIDGYELTFGGADEPVITGERMWLEVRITDEDGEPVTGQEDTLQWKVEKPGEDSAELEASEKHGEPGVYRAAVIFTEPGEYVIHIEGTIEDTEAHTHFEKEVHDHTDLEFPGQTAESAAMSGFGIGVAGVAIAAIAVAFIGRRV